MTKQPAVDLGRPARSGFLLLAALLAFCAPHAGLHGATCVPPLSLADLALQSDAVILAEARDSRTVPRGALRFTDTEFVVAESISGRLRAGDVIQVQVPGGELGGTIWRVPGAPSFRLGRRYFVCLDSRPDGVWIPMMLSYGVLEEVPGEGGAHLLVPLPEAALSELLPRPDGQPAEPVVPYYSRALMEHLGEVLSGRSGWSASRAAAPPEDVPLGGGGAAVPAGCDFFISDGRRFRWRTFDGGGSATVFVDSRGDLSLPGGGFREVAEALDMWMAISGNGVNLVLGGTRDIDPSCAGGGSQANMIVLNDPCSEIPDLQGCGGTLAFGGPIASGTHGFDGSTWWTITGWFVVVNNGSGCLGSNSWRIMMAHELGHGLGFGHVADSRALMYASCCNNPNSTDITCLRFAYPQMDPQNQRPDVDAGTSVSLDLARNSLRISGSAMDDGRPLTPEGLTTEWRQLAGPAGVRFLDASSAETMVTFPESGAYLLGLTASDGNLLRTDPVELTVNLWSGSQVGVRFQQRAGGYSGTVDTTLRESDPGAVGARDTELSVDADDPGGSQLQSQVLLRFDDVFGPGDDQVPPGAQITSAALELTVTNQGDGAGLHRLVEDWSDEDSWSMFGGDGIQADVEALRGADASVQGVGDAVRIDVTQSLAAWSPDPCENHGWAFLPLGDDGWDFESAEGNEPPRLTVDYLVAESRTIVETDDVWRYFKGTSAPPGDWNTAEFAPGAAWLSGRTGIGYGDGDDRTQLGDMRDRYLTIFCRRAFDMEDPHAFGRLILRIDYDDGFIAYLNGEEVARSASMGPPGTPADRNTPAASREAGNFEEHPLEAGLLRQGANVLAVEIHNASLDSSDISFIPELIGSRVFLDEGSDWRFLRGSEPVPPDWMEEGFDDSGWEIGRAGIGYGDGDDLTVLDGMRGSYVTVFCRRSFEVADPAAVEELLLTAIHDDGIVAYLNGAEIGRANMPAGAVTRSTRAAGAGEPQATTFRIPASRLKLGTNTLAASVHNASLDSSDLSFAAVLVPVSTAPASVTCGEVPVFLFRRGDTTASSDLEITDAIRILGFLFLGGEDLGCHDAADVDDSGAVNITDAVRLLSFLFLGAEPPPSPADDCGEDPTPDDLGDCSSADCAP